MYAKFFVYVLYDHDLVDTYMTSSITKELKRSRNRGKLTENLTRELRDMITSGKLEDGARLPSQKQIEDDAGVSRTVVREAIAALQAEGLVDVKHGVGIFVQNTRKVDFQISSSDFDQARDAYGILELRLAIEVEMAGLAARRRTEQQLENINLTLHALEQKSFSGENSTTEDFAFHVAIAQASNNKFFCRFLEFLGEQMIPTRSLIVENTNSFTNESYLERLYLEHLAIAEAIADKDARRAQNAARTHLAGSLERHGRLISATDSGES
ncbi:MAG: FadR/GntR family transcriptional regulator [Henriciella sp.]